MVMRGKYFSIDESLADALELVSAVSRKPQVFYFEKAIYKLMRDESEQLANDFDRGKVMELLQAYEAKYI